MISKDHLIKRSLIQQSMALSQPSSLWSMTSWYWPSFWSYASLGHHITRLMVEAGYSKSLVCRHLFKNILRAFVSQSAEMKFPADFEPSRYKSIIFGWATKEQIPSVLSGKDIYFGELSEKEKTESLRLISLVGPVPEELKEKLLNAGMVFIHWKKDRLKPFKVLKVFLGVWLKRKIFFKDWYKYLDPKFMDAQFLQKTWEEKLHLMNQVRYFFIPYEAQPIQQMLLDICHHICPDIQTIGYLHSTLVPFPTDVIYTPAAPKKLWVHGSAYKSILSRYLHWPEERILEIPSFRYTNEKAFEAKIYLPISLDDKEKLLLEIDAFLASCQTAIKPLRIGIHPGRVSDPEHIEFAQRLEQVLQKHQFLFAEDGASLCVIFGITSALFEALENGLGVVNVISQPDYEIYSQEIFPDLKIEKISEWTYSYRLEKKGAYIDYGRGERKELVARVY